MRHLGSCRLRGCPRTLWCGPSEMMGLVRMPRTSGNFLCSTRISSALGVSIQAWATMALGMPWRAAISLSHRRLGDLLAAVALGLHVHGGDDIVQRRVAAILLGQVGSAQRRIVAHVGMLAAGEPGIAQPALEVPEMMMGIDDGQVVVHSGRAPRCVGRTARSTGWALARSVTYRHGSHRQQQHA